MPSLFLEALVLLEVTARRAAPQVQKSSSEAGGCSPQPQRNAALPQRLRAALGCWPWASHPSPTAAPGLELQQGPPV